MTAKTKAPLPNAGGSYIRNTNTGGLEVAPTDAALIETEAPAEKAGKPQTKPGKSSVKET